jgi:hypothetical protein
MSLMSSPFVRAFSCFSEAIPQVADRLPSQTAPSARRSSFTTFRNLPSFIRTTTTGSMSTDLRVSLATRQSQADSAADR